MGVEVQLYSLSCAVDGYEWAASLPGRLYPSGKGPLVLILLLAGWEPMPIVEPGLLSR